MKKNSLRNIVFLLFLLVLIPTLFYTAYEFSTLNSSEQMLGEIYSRQLDAILYSVNEYTTALLTTWANRLSDLFRDASLDDVRRMMAAETKSAQVVSLDYVAFADSDGTYYAPGPAFPHMPPGIDTLTLQASLRRSAWKLTRLGRYLRTGYRKIEPIFLGDSSLPNTRVALAFAFSTASRAGIIVFLLKEEDFIRLVISRKLNEVAGDNFTLGVMKKNPATLIYATSTTDEVSLRHRKKLWIFPGYDLGIRLKGTTIDELARTRTQRNLLLIVAMNLLLLAGAWFVYRSIRREMELAQLKSDFVSNVSHELRTPLALIRMYGETLAMGRTRSDEQKQEYYATIVKETERLTRLVNNILDFSKMEAGKKHYVFSDVQLNEIVHSVMSTYDFHLKQEGVSTDVRLDGELPPISADPEAVAEAIVNLVDNAIKYSGEQKSVHVRTLRERDHCLIEVADRGVGISVHDQSRIFDKFYRVGDALVHNTKGSGLGLSLVKHIMDAHNGKVEVESEVGKGSTFRLMFPLKRT